MKKSTRKLIPAVVMLLISAIMMSTASFAWFSMNQQVYVNPMTITANASDTFLVISNSNSANEAGNTATRADALTATATLFPAAYVDGQWKQGHGLSADDGRKDGELEVIDETVLNQYVLHNTFYIRTAKGTLNATNLKLAAVTVDGTSVFTPAVSVVVKVDDKVNTYIDGTVTNGTALATTVTDAADIVVEVYVYINGENGVVKTSNIVTENALAGIEVELEFRVD